MNRAESIGRLVKWAAGIALLGLVAAGFTAFMYAPTLAGGSPWSWHFGEAHRALVFLLGLGVGLGIAFAGIMAAHFYWPRTEAWPRLERVCARFVWHVKRGEHVGDRVGVFPMRCRTCREYVGKIEAEVRPHVLEREA